jgi:hypothetical protein
MVTFSWILQFYLLVKDPKKNIQTKEKRNIEYEGGYFRGKGPGVPICGILYQLLFLIE